MTATHRAGPRGGEIGVGLAVRMRVYRHTLGCSVVALRAATPSDVGLLATVGDRRDDR